MGQLPLATPNPKSFHVVHQAAAAATARLDATEAGVDAGAQQPSLGALVRFQATSKNIERTAPPLSKRRPPLSAAHSKPWTSIFMIPAVVGIPCETGCQANEHAPKMCAELALASCPASSSARQWTNPHYYPLYCRVEA